MIKKLLLAATLVVMTAMPARAGAQATASITGPYGVAANGSTITLIETWSGVTGMQQWVNASVACFQDVNGDGVVNAQYYATEDQVYRFLTGPSTDGSKDGYSGTATLSYWLNWYGTSPAVCTAQAYVYNNKGGTLTITPTGPTIFFNAT